MNNLKVLQVSSDPMTFEKLLHLLIDNLLIAGFDVHICCGKGELGNYLKKNAIKVIQLDTSRKMFSFKHVGFCLKFLRLLKSKKYDIVHFHSPVIAALGRIIAKLAGVPVIIYTAHGFYFHENMNPFVYKLYFYIEKFICRWTTDWLFLQSKEDAIIAFRNRFIKNLNKIIHIGNGVVPENFLTGEIRNYQRKVLNIADDEKVITFIGRIVKEKGILDLIKAFHIASSQHSNIKLLIIGDILESDRDKKTKLLIKEYIRNYRLKDKILFLGFRDDIPQLLSATDIFVLPSYREGMPRSIIEAMMSGKPVIATNIRGCREEVVDGETGILVSPGDVNGLARAMDTLINNPELAKQMGIKGRKRALELFNENHVVEKQINIYLQIKQLLCS